MKTGLKRQSDLPSITQQVNGKVRILTQAWQTCSSHCKILPSFEKPLSWWWILPLMGVSRRWLHNQRKPPQTGRAQNKLQKWGLDRKSSEWNKIVLRAKPWEFNFRIGCWKCFFFFFWKCFLFVVRFLFNSFWIPPRQKSRSRPSGFSV